MSPEEWDSFIEYLRKPLPAAFRINSRFIITFLVFFPFPYFLCDVSLL